MILSFELINFIFEMYVVVKVTYHNNQFAVLELSICLMARHRHGQYLNVISDCQSSYAFQKQPLPTCLFYVHRTTGTVSCTYTCIRLQSLCRPSVSKIWVYLFVNDINSRSEIYGQTRAHLCLKLKTCPSQYSLVNIYKFVQLTVHSEMKSNDYARTNVLNDQNIMNRPSILFYLLENI